MTSGDTHAPLKYPQAEERRKLVHKNEKWLSKSQIFFWGTTYEISNHSLVIPNACYSHELKSYSHRDISSLSASHSVRPLLLRMHQPCPNWNFLLQQVVSPFNRHWRKYLSGDIIYFYPMKSSRYPFICIKSLLKGYFSPGLLMTPLLVIIAFYLIQCRYTYT